jgi:hypothetical protein
VALYPNCRCGLNCNRSFSARVCYLLPLICSCVPRSGVFPMREASSNSVSRRAA